MNANVDKKQMRLYLLGALPEAEQVALEQAYFADGEIFEQVWAQENELVDDYVRGKLGETDRQLFEKNYLSLPKHRNRVLTAQQLLAAADALRMEALVTSTPTSTTTESFWEKLQAFLRPPQLIWAGAFVLLAVLGGVWLTQFRTEKEPQIVVASPAPTLTSSPTITSSAPSVTPVPTGSPAPKMSPQPATSAPAVFAFVLLGSGARGDDNVQRVAIPAETQQVRLQIKLPADEYSRYQTTLRSVEGRDVLTRVIAKPTIKNRMASLTIPAAQLPAGDYFLILSALNQNQEAEELGQYFFRVSRK